MANSAGFRAELEALPHGVLLHDAPRFTELAKTSTLRQAWGTMRHDGHPPLYFVLLLLWRRLVGDGEFAVRELSALLSVLSILPAALIVKELGRARLAPWVALVLAISYAHVRMAQEARPYALSILLVTTATWLLARMERLSLVSSRVSAVPPGLKGIRDAANPALKCGATLSRPSGTKEGGVQCIQEMSRIVRRECRNAVFLAEIGYAVLLLLAMLNHYFAALALGAHGVYTSLRFRGRLLRDWMVAVGAAAGMWISVWGATFLSQREFIAGQDWLREEHAEHALRSMMRFVDLPMRLIFDHEAFLVTPGKALTGAGIVIGIAYVTIRNRIGAALLPALWVLIPALVFVAIDLLAGRQMLSHLRYTSVAVPGLVILVVIAAAELPKVWRAGLLGTYVITVALTLMLPTQQNPHSREAAAILAQNVRRGEPVVYDAIEWPRFWASSMYLTVSYYQAEPMAPLVLLREAARAELLSALEKSARIHVVSPRVGVDVNPLPGKFERVYKSEHVEGIGWVYVFEKR